MTEQATETTPAAEPASENGVYSPAERQILTIWDGARWVKRDPARVRRRLFAEIRGEDLDGLLKQIEGPEDYAELPPDAQKAMDAISSQGLDTLLPAIYKAFELKPLNDAGEGVTETEATAAFDAFCNLVGRLKKVEPNSPSGSPPLAQAG